MPNKLSRVRSSAAINMEGSAVTLRPILAVKIAEILANGSLIETSFVKLMSSILSAEKVGVAAMLSTIINFRTKMDLAYAAIQKKFDGDDVAIASAVFSYVGSAMSQRNKVAHYVKAVCNELSNDLLLIEPEAYVEAFTEDDDLSIQPFTFKPRIPSFERIWVYTEKDFQAITEKMIRSNLYISLLDTYLLLKPKEEPFFDFSHVRKAVLDSLCEEPSIASAVYRAASPNPGAGKPGTQPARRGKRQR